MNQQEGFKISKMKVITMRIISILFLIVLFFFLPATGANADVLDDVDSSLLTGVSIAGQANSLVESVTIYTPEDGFDWLGFNFDWAKLKIVSFGGLYSDEDLNEVVYETTFAGHLGQSDTFFISVKSIDEPLDEWAGGVLYNLTQHLP